MHVGSFRCNSCAKVYKLVCLHLWFFFNNSLLTQGAKAYALRIILRQTHATCTPAGSKKFTALTDRLLIGSPIAWKFPLIWVLDACGIVIFLKINCLCLFTCPRTFSQSAGDCHKYMYATLQ